MNENERITVVMLIVCIAFIISVIQLRIFVETKACMADNPKKHECIWGGRK